MSPFVGNRWFLLACVVGLSVAGLVGVVGADANGQVIGWTCLLFFGVAGGATVIGEFVAGPPRPVERLQVALPGGTTASALVLAYRRYPGLVRFVVGVGIVAGGAVFALAPRAGTGGGFDNLGARAVVGLGAAFFAVVTVLRLLIGVNARDTIALTAKGLLASAAGTSRYVTWASVTSVQRRDFRGSPMLAVVARSHAAIVRSGGAGLVDGIGTLFYGANQIPISLKSLALPPDEVAALVRACYQHSRIGMTEGLSDGSTDSVDPVWFDQLAKAITAP